MGTIDLGSPSVSGFNVVFGATAKNNAFIFPLSFYAFMYRQISSFGQIIVFTKAESDMINKTVSIKYCLYNFLIITFRRVLVSIQEV